MKTKLSLFLIPFLSLIIFIIPSTVLSQWIDHGDYKEIKVSKYEINQLVMPKNDKYFYVTDTSGKYMIFDYDGKLYFSKSLYFENSGYASVRSPNNSTFGATFMDYNLKRRLFLFTYY